jgi:hypothetical protein
MATRLACVRFTWPPFIVQLRGGLAIATRACARGPGNSRARERAASSGLRAGLLQKAAQPDDSWNGTCIAWGRCGPMRQEQGDTLCLREALQPACARLALCATATCSHAGTNASVFCFLCLYLSCVLQATACPLGQLVARMHGLAFCSARAAAPTWPKESLPWSLLKAASPGAVFPSSTWPKESLPWSLLKAASPGAACPGAG